MTALWLLLVVLIGIGLIWLAARWQDRRREDWPSVPPRERGWPADGSPAIPPGHGEPYYIGHGCCHHCGAFLQPEQLHSGQVCPKCKLVI